MKILILGYGRGGKDTLAEILANDFGLSFTSSSRFAAEKFICKALKPAMSYLSIESCYEDRHNHRDLWHELIKAYNYFDRSRLAKEMLEAGYDIYVGMRCKKELEASRDLFDLIVWVDGVERTGYTEPSSSCTTTEEMAHVILTNNGTEEEFRSKIIKLFGLMEWKE